MIIQNGMKIIANLNNFMNPQCLKINEMRTAAMFQTDVNGVNCETKYSIVAKPGRSGDLSSAAEKVVMKVKDFERCHKSVKNSEVEGYDVGLFAGLFHYGSEKV